ncbi:MAG: hypothetical protein HRU70_04310 [Phycisphaeraceae bacterium]|nr:MAG: hypothetical protein HRU70_04310 [Phycisphaeraceae bacterium]
MKHGHATTRHGPLHLLATAALGVVSAAYAAQPAIVWSSIDGGAAFSDAGGLTARATVGQPDASAPLSAGGLVLVSGYHTAPAPCQCDLNMDGFLDFFDFDDFVTRFQVASPAADFNRDGFLDFFDFDAFLSAFEKGC